MSHLVVKYRPEIDGLRAIAVIAVILYHFFPSVMPGGFLGVDIFFVISGYLISKIIALSLRDNKFSILNFYIKRIKRIFPALIIVCLLFLAYGWFVLFPNEFREMGRHISYSTVFLSNVALYRDVGYFDGYSAQKPFMHLWSLSVEEQFYLVWPLVLWAFFRLWKNKGIIPFLTISILASYGLNMLMMTWKPNLAFYFPGSRFWEIGSGALAAYLELYKKDAIEISLQEWSSLLRVSLPNLLSVFGVFSIAGSLFFLHATDPLFSSLAFLPVLGSFCIILNPCSTYISKALSHPLVVLIGLISYPMYLFHWPMISFIHIVQPSLLGNALKGILLLLTVLLSYLTYKFVETPIRKNSSKKVVLILLGMMTVLGGVSCLVKNKYLNPFVSYKFPQSVKVTDAHDDWEGISEEMVSFKLNGFDFYRFGNEKKVILFLGDSHMEQYRPRIRQLYLNHKISGKSVVFANHGGMCPVPAVNRRSITSNAYCIESFRQYALNNGVQEIVIGASWIFYLQGGPDYYCTIEGKEYLLDTKDGQACLYKSLEQMIKEFVSLGKKVYIMLPTPNGMSEYDPKSLLERNLLGRWKYFPSKSVKFQAWEKISKNAKDILKEIAQRTGARIINPEGDFCKKGYCRSAAEDGTFIYKDSGHVRAWYARNYLKCLDFLFYKE